MRAQDTSHISTPAPVGSSPRIPLSPFSEPFPFETYRYGVEIDSVTGDVRLFDSLLGVPYSQTQTYSLEQYLLMRQRAQLQQMWEERATKYELSAAPRTPKDDLESILGTGGPSIDIPLPPGLGGIFGPPTISINVSGSVSISAGWQWDNNNLTSISGYGTTQSAPFFNQTIQASVSGKVGDKLKLTTDFDTQRSFDFDNQMKIQFGGGPETDDDIPQVIEAGNVSLQTPSQLIGGSQTLFGVKAGLKFGRLLLTTIAAQKRGERKTVTVSSGSVKSSITVKPYDYAQNHFWLDTVYKRFYDDYYRNTPPAATPEMAPYNVTDIEVYEQVKDGSQPSQFKAIAYADLPAVGPGGRYSDALRVPPANATSGTVQAAAFIRMQQGQGYEFDRQLGTITLKTWTRDKIYAVAYKTSTKGTYGEFSNTRPDSGSVAVLKLICVVNLQPAFTTLWARQMKNIYQLQGVRNVNLQNSRIIITYGVPPDTSEVLRVEGSPRVVTALGVDRLNTSDQPQPDGDFDIRAPYFFNPASGEIIFPSTEPFRKGLRLNLGANAESYVLDAIYDQTRTDAERDARTSRYTISGDISGSGGSKINLNAYNIAPNSIKVFSNGEQLVENVDYRVDAVFGEVTLISARANNASGNVQVEYEQNDFYTIAQKNLLGLRADYELFRGRNLKSKIGATFMRYGQSLPTEKVQIYSGEEPVTNMMFGFDGNLEYKADFLTKWIDALPFIDTKESSILRFSGEIASIAPNPNNKESLVASDGGKGAAYIDDFESGAKRQIQLGISYTYWHPASAPADITIGNDDSSRVNNKALYWWYNRSPANTPTAEIYPNRNIAVGAQTTSVLDILFDPHQRGIYNPDFTYEPATPARRSVAWGGMMRSLSYYASNLNLNQENVDYLELTLKVQRSNGTAKMYIDIGQISEDVIPDRQLNTEDGITPANTQQDGILNQGEDVGIDGMNDEQERQRFGVQDEDPMRDNYKQPPFRSDNVYDYENVDGLESNVGQERGPFPDAEDLNGNRSLDIDNSYFEYEINLDPDPKTNPQIIGVSVDGNGNDLGWRQYRIPLRSGYRSVGAPSFGNVQFARVWVKGEDTTHIRIAEMNLVGSDWRNVNSPIGDTLRDPKLEVTFVNLEENYGPPDFYTVPPGVRQEIDLATDTRKNEQSLAIRVQELERGESRAAIRIRPRPFDVFNYKQMKFFLHGSGDMDDLHISGQPAKVYAYIRFGWDSLNYYEYRVPLLRGWNEYTINFADLAAIKQARGNQNRNTPLYFPVPGQPDYQFAVRGEPSLTRIQFVAYGIQNNAYPGALTTTMWVDELRAVNAEDANDWAATVNASAKLADLGNLNMNFSRFNPNFHRLEERFGDRVEHTNWAFNSTFNLEKLLPNAFKGSILPLTYNHIERIEKPRNIAQSDVNLDGAVNRIQGDNTLSPQEKQRLSDSLTNATQTLVVEDAFGLSNIKIVFPGQGWYVRDIFNRFSFGYDYSQRRERSPLVTERFHWEWKFKGDYQVNIPPNFELSPFKKLLNDVPVLSFWRDFRMNLLPSSFSASTNISRSRTTEQLRNIEFPSPVNRNFLATRSAQFNWRMTDGGLVNLTTDYQLNAQSSLTHLETDISGRQREGDEILKDLFFSDGRLFNFGRDNNYTQSVTFNTRPRIPFIPGIERYLTPTARYKVDYTWTDQLTQTVSPGSFTKSASWRSTSTLGLDIRLQQIGDALFGTRRDTNESVITSTLRYLIKFPFLEFRNLSLQYTQTSESQNPGVQGSTGLTNLWARSLLFRSESPSFGPGTAYQLGLTPYPHGTLKFGFKSSFPFIGAEEKDGVRAPNIYVKDNFTQDNNLTGSTDRPLWTGASLSLNWNLKYGYNKNLSVTTDGLGIPTYSDALLTSNLSRSYLSLPNLFFVNVFHNDIEGVVDEYKRRKSAIPTPQLAGNTSADTIAYNTALVAYNKRITEALSETFEEQLEAFNWLPGKLGHYLPRLNWTITWNGLEQLPFLKDWAQNVTLRHSYTGRYNFNYRETTEGRVPETQTVSRGFQPLIEVNVTAKPEVFKGSASGSISYTTSNDFTLVSSSRSEISSESKSELQMRASYQRRGLKVPIFGLNLNNDIEFSTTFSIARTNRKRFDLTNFTPDGNNDGSTRINFHPSIRYSFSSIVTAAAFVDYSATIPDAEGSRDISRSTTKVGIDLRLGISGGR